MTGLKCLAAGMAALFALSGCGNDPKEGFVTNTIAGLLTPSEDVVPLRQSLTPEAVAALDRPLLVISLLDRGQEALAIELSRRGRIVTWASTDGVSVSITDGIVQATRGLGGDLMVADLREIGPALRNGAAGALRVHRYVDGENETVARVFVCDVQDGGSARTDSFFGARTGRLTIEACSGPDLEFENRYWFDQSGRVFKSVQWIGPNVGRLQFEQINR